MMDLPRIKDRYAGSLEGRLIGSAGADRPSSGARRRTLLAVGAVGTAAALPTAATTAAAGAKAVGVTGLVAVVKWAGVGFAVGALTIAGVQQVPRWLEGSSHAPPTEPQIPKPPPSVDSKANEVAPSTFGETSPDSPVPKPESLALPIQQTDDRAALHRAPFRSPPAREPMASAPAVAVPSELRLAEEMAILDEASRAMTESPARTLSLLDAYDERFPAGDLAPEALVLRVEGLVRTSQIGVAESLARKYLARHGSGLHATRIRTLLGWREKN